MVERGIAIGNQLRQIGRRDISGEQAHHLERQLGVGKLRPFFEPASNLRQLLRQQQATVGRQPRHDRILKTNRLHPPACTDVFHFMNPA